MADLQLVFRAPGHGGVLRDLVSRALPRADSHEIARAFASGGVRVAGARVREPGQRVAGGARIDLRASEGTRAARRAAVALLQRGADFCVVAKPAGWSSGPASRGRGSARELVATAIGLPPAAIRPVHELAEDVAGAWLIALSDAALARLRAALRASPTAIEYRALAPRLPWPDGALLADFERASAEIRFEALEPSGGICELRLAATLGGDEAIRRALAAARAPVLADARFGGVMVAGGLRLYSRRVALADEGIDAAVGEPAQFQPREASFPDPRTPVLLEVSHATAVALARGHPWILADRATSDVGGYRPGTLARARSTRGAEVGLFRIEGPGRIAARSWRFAGSDSTALGERVERALAKRSALLEGLRGEERATTAFRLLHGEADGVPGLAVDLLEDELRLLLLGRAAEPLVEELVATLAARLPMDPAAVLVTHLAERPKGELRCVRPLRGRPRVEPFCVREAGYAFEVENGLREPMVSRPGIGLFLDQRANRARIARRIRERGGGRWLNLFCHTGAFSVVALGAGADRVVSVDLSRPYLETLERNLARNRLDGARHECVRMDAVRFLERLGASERFDGVVLDPPTAAAAGRRFWSARKLQSTLIARCLALLSPRGALLVCRNDRSARGELRALVAREAARSRVELAELEEAGPAPDFPRLAGFREGDAFEGALAIRRG